MDAVVAALCFALGLSLDLLAAFLLEVSALHFLQLSGEPLNLVLVLVDLGLIHVEFGCHRLHLGCLFLKILLVDGELFSNFWTGLSRKQVFQFNIKLFFLLDDDILFDNFLRFLD